METFFILSIITIVIFLTIVIDKIIADRRTCPNCGTKNCEIHHTNHLHFNHVCPNCLNEF